MLRRLVQLHAVPCREFQARPLNYYIYVHRGNAGGRNLTTGVSTLLEIATDCFANIRFNLPHGATSRNAADEIGDIGRKSGRSGLNKNQKCRVPAWALRVGQQIGLSHDARNGPRTKHVVLRAWNHDSSFSRVMPEVMMRPAYTREAPAISLQQRR